MPKIEKHSINFHYFLKSKKLKLNKKIIVQEEWLKLTLCLM